VFPAEDAMRTVSRLLQSCVFLVVALVGLHGQAPKTFRVWVFSDAHVGSDQTMLLLALVASRYP
jgi:hypothetical protein